MAHGTTAVSRRTLLLGSGGTVAVAVLAAACAEPGAPTPISPDQAALNTALAGETALIAAFTPGVDGTPAQQRRGEAALRSQRVHADALIDAGASASASPPPSTATPTSTATATSAAKSARELARLQRNHADRLDQLALGVSPRVALLLGSIAASDAATAALLTAGR